MSISSLSRHLHALNVTRKSVAHLTLMSSARSSLVPTPTPLLITGHHYIAPAHRISNDYFSTLGGTSFQGGSDSDTDIIDDDGGPVGSSARFKHMTNEQLADMSTIPGWNLVHNPPRRNPKGALVGKVVSDKMQKTVNVAVDRFKMIPKYRKRWRFTRKFMAHDEHEVCNVGDLVMIVPCQRISRHKHFMVREIIRAKGQL